MAKPLPPYEGLPPYSFLEISLGAACASHSTTRPSDTLSDHYPSLFSKRLFSGMRVDWGLQSHSLPLRLHISRVEIYR